MEEYEVLDNIYEALPDIPPFGISLYEVSGDMTRPELYVTINNECWRIKAERHYHPED